MVALTCRECKLEMGSRDALAAHWQKQRNEGKRHYHCSLCMEPFRTPEAEHRHHKEIHAAKQNLDCPGCNERANRCKRIKNDDYVARREEKLAFARELQRLHPNLPDDSSVATLSLAETAPTRQGPNVASGTRSLSSLRPKAENTVRPNPVTFAIKRERNINLFPDAPPALRPSRETQEALQRPAQTKDTAWPPHNPQNPRWDPAEYFVAYIKKYKCRHNRYPKSFPSVAGIRAHLLSAQHAGLVRGVRCNLSETNGYRQFLDQLTAGLVDTTEKNDDGIEKYEEPNQSREWFGTEQGRAFAS
ncbi:hypothetical protein N657DRAFT_661882 [Parathielavia appendiculata]|uniref:C2H2-type domain-containing protein n=1 Tax=Parathielavia appendiculata TaxID=2587402 RepID=A0AAN6U7V8_9PEZI|nr:hypothetical protein N657DRAFT_661882 [Parathielavia appendiculata]